LHYVSLLSDRVVASSGTAVPKPAEGSPSRATPPTSSYPAPAGGLGRPAHTSTLTVLNNADSGSGSLRDTIAAANSGHTIVFSHSVHYITLTSGKLAVTQSLTIDGPGADQLTISGANASRAKAGSDLLAQLHSLDGAAART
jgi:hypothetical protein